MFHFISPLAIKLIVLSGRPNHWYHVQPHHHQCRPSWRIFYRYAPAGDVGVTESLYGQHRTIHRPAHVGQRPGTQRRCNANVADINDPTVPICVIISSVPPSSSFFCLPFRRVSGGMFWCIRSWYQLMGSQIR
jgi:hypothetical protein